ncbi:MAG: HlyD family type I secretion periplasmic adaptor subunit [Sulfurimonas sp.]|uniref:HlyD family type I secretion periplasmic adaptor subunit n=1 Tax=Sulfurimonas sp. TaxID=2022749 RepID=UPI0028CDD03C|nr:HlyD family type I secretion periplasmic adaptor subunit [Sulfurimonas sp.]MDT8339103.1 HlyD family type I secretion periplasmic adaptor subunit [Sulfurimonas sp.]
MDMFSTKDRHEFRPLLVEIEERPTSPLGRGLLWTILAFMVITTLWLFLAKIDVVVTARGKVIPLGEIKVLQPIETGVISSISVIEGDYVTKGQILMEIDPSVTDTNLDSKLKNLELLDVEMARLTALVKNEEFYPSKITNDKNLLSTQKLIYDTKRSGYHQQLQLVTQQINQVDSQKKSITENIDRVKKLSDSAVARAERLFEVRDLITQEEYESARKDVIEYEEQTLVKKHEVNELDSKQTELIEQILFITQDYKNKLLEELTEKRKEATMLQVEIKSIQFKQSKQRLISPVDGYIGKLHVHTVGGVVTPAEKLITVIPKDAPLIIKATVLNQDSGFIKKGMQTAVKIDTFDFQKYGMIHGVVTHKADDSVDDEKLGPVYEIYIEPKEHFLTVNSEKVFLRSGMSVTAEMKVGKRRVIEFFLYPLIKYLDEGMSVR